MARTGASERRAGRTAQLREHERARRARGPEWVVLALALAFLVSGSAGLIHEVVWVRLLGHLFGATSLAVSTVLAAFMGGLAIGSYWIGRWSERLQDRRRAYAMLEIGIGLFALAVPALLALVEPLYGVIWRRFQFSFAVFSVLRFAVAASILLVPTMMMGATLPVLADYLALLRGRRLKAEWLYTMNLIGAVVGVAAAGFVLMPWVGVWGTIIIGALLNVAVGVVVLLLPPLPEREVADDEPAEEAPAPMRMMLVVALVSGFVSLATQVAWTRVLTLIVGSTTYAFSSVLVVYLVALAVGSAWAARRGARLKNVGPPLVVAHVLTGLTLVATLYSVNRLPYWYLRLYERWHPESLTGIVGLNSVLVFIVLFLPVVCAGTILPLALIGALPPGVRTGPAVGRVYAVNTAGAIVGSVLGGFVLVPFLGSQVTLLGIAILVAVLGCVLAVWTAEPRWLAPLAIGATAAVVIGVLARPTWNYLELHAGVFEPGRLGNTSTDVLTEEGEHSIFHREGPTASVMVVQRKSGTRVLIINGRVNAGDHASDMVTQVLIGQLPLLLAPRADDVFIVGWGSGVTVGAAAQSPAKNITVVELEPAVVEASHLFDHVNNKPLEDPRVRLYEDDARHILVASEDTYDVIISEPPHPWVTGVANLFTQDFYRLVVGRLRPGGIVAQWLQSYQISFDTYRTILATFHSVFPQVFVFHSPGTADTILVGSLEKRPIDLAELDRRWNHEATRAELARVGIKRPEQVVASLYLGPASVSQLSKDVPINTDNNMFVEFRGPKDALRGMDETIYQTFASLGPYVTRVESALVDPNAILDSRDRLQALIAALKATGRATATYEARLKGLP
jgi:spermidine synthase